MRADDEAARVAGGPDHPPPYPGRVRLDLTALEQQPSSADLADLRRRARSGEFGPTQHQVGATIFVAVVVVIMGVSGWFFFNAWNATAGAMPGAGRLATFGRFFQVAWFAVFGLIAFTLVRGVVKSIADRNDWARLALFARANGLQFRRRSADPQYPGMIFSQGHGRASIDHVWSPTGLLADAGTYRYTIGSGEDATTYTWKFAAFRLPRPLPHLVLDARANDSVGRSNLPAEYRSSQLVALGEPFDSRFRTYAPEGYASDAFRLLPPNLLERLLALPPDWDVEIVDDWLFLYCSGADFAEPAVWSTLGDVEAGLADGLARQAGRYADPHSAGAAPVALATGIEGRPVAPIAAQGRRLQTTWVRGLIVTLLTIAAMLIAQYLLKTYLF